MFLLLFRITGKQCNGCLDGDWKGGAEGFTNISRQFKPHRDISKKYDVEEGYTILRSAKLVNTEYELYEELVRPYNAFTESCRQILLRGVSKLIKEDAPLKSRSISRFLHFSHWLPFSAVVPSRYPSNRTWTWGKWQWYIKSIPD